MSSGRYGLLARRLMRAPRLRIVVTYSLSLLTVIGMLVFWVVYVVRSSQRIAELAARLGVTGENVHWAVLWFGCWAFFFVILTLTYHAAQALSARTRSLEQAEFLSNVTHELKSPLAAIQLHAQTLQQEGIDEARRQSFVATILEQAERMSLLVDNVLESSRLRARKRATDLQPIELAEFLTDYLGQRRREILDHGAKLEVHIQTRAVVMATSDALQRILGNLIDNALHHGGQANCIRCRAEDLGPRVRISIEDDGVGIPRRDLARIFDRFYQVHSQDPAHRSGTGLGLSIVRGLVEELGGSVRALAGDSSGTRMEILLPVSSASS